MGAYLAIKSRNLFTTENYTEKQFLTSLTYNGLNSFTAVATYDAVKSKVPIVWFDFELEAKTYTISLDLTSVGALTDKRPNELFIFKKSSPPTLQAFTKMSATDTTNKKIVWKFTLPEKTVWRFGFYLNVQGSGTAVGQQTMTCENIHLVEGSYNALTMPAYEPYYTYKRVKAFGRMVRNPKNLIPFPYVHSIGNSGTTKGVNYAINNDGSITLNGTPTANAGLRLFQDTFALEEGKTYTLYLKNTPQYYWIYLPLIHIADGDSEHSGVASTLKRNPITFTYTKGSSLRLDLIILKDIGKIDNVTVYPMLVEGSYTASTIPNYFAPTKCTIRMRPTIFPARYQRVEYIESTGTQYIDTLFKPNQDTRVICRAKVPVSNETNFLFGARESGSAKMFGFCASGAGNYLTMYNISQPNWDKELNSDGVITVDMNKNTTTITTKSLSKSHTIAKGEFTAPCNLVLAGCNTNGSVTGGRVVIYSCQVYDNGKLVRDFIPCYRRDDDSEIGLFDIVSGVFFTNQGTGTFRKGANV